MKLAAFTVLLMLGGFLWTIRTEPSLCPSGNVELCLADRLLASTPRPQKSALGD